MAQQPHKARTIRHPMYKYGQLYRQGRNPVAKPRLCEARLGLHPMDKPDHDSAGNRLHTGSSIARSKPVDDCRLFFPLLDRHI